MKPLTHPAIPAKAGTPIFIGRAPLSRDGGSWNAVARLLASGNSDPVTMLVRHPDTPPGAIQAVDAELRRTSGGAVATFRAVGDTSRLVIPPSVEPVRTDELWKTTCFEIFVGEQCTSYMEFNLSPSEAWAAYHFDDYRSGMREAAVEIRIQSSFNPKGFLLEAEIQSEFTDPARIGLTAVIEEADGIIRYWSTAFAPGKPDFHAPAVRSLLFDGIGTE